MFLPSARIVEIEIHLWWRLMKSPWIDRHGLQRHLWFLSVEFTMKFCWNLRSSRLVPALEWILGIRSLFLTILLYHLQMGIWVHHLFVWSVFLSRWFFEDTDLMHPTFCNSSRSAYQNIFSSNSSVPQAVWLVFGMVLQNVFWIRSFPVCQEFLDISQIATAFHGIRPPRTIQSGLQ